jgi:peptidoglycan/xylan/chitin deacetylase (PgdA/CDA1 family)
VELWQRTLDLSTRQKHTQNSEEIARAIVCYVLYYSVIERPLLSIECDRINGTNTDFSCVVPVSEPRRQPATGPELLARPSADCPVLLTFDDGGVSAVLHVADMLDEFGWKAHFLVTAGRIGAPGFLDRPQIQELRRRGHIIGSHSYTHPLRMAHCLAAELDNEWQRSVLSLTEILGEPVQVASVPGGYYSRRVALAAARAGIKLLFNSETVTRSQTVDGCLVLGRFTAKRGHQPRRLAAIIAGDRQLQIRECLFWNAKKVAKVLLGGAWLRARVMLLERRARNASRPGVDSRS